MAAVHTHCCTKPMPRPAMRHSRSWKAGAARNLERFSGGKARLPTVSKAQHFTSSGPLRISSCRQGPALLKVLNDSIQTCAGRALQHIWLGRAQHLGGPCDCFLSGIVRRCAAYKDHRVQHSPGPGSGSVLCADEAGRHAQCWCIGVRSAGVSTFLTLQGVWLR